MIDGEIRAMNRAWLAIQGLDAVSRQRVIDYLAKRSESVESARRASLAAENRGCAAPDKRPVGAAPAEMSRDWRVEIGKWIAEGCLNKITDRVLVTAALLQWEHPGRDFSAKEIHQPLKDLNLPVVNISAQIGAIMERGPKRWIIQSERRGKAGHKRYTVTPRGLEAARQLIADAGRE